MLEKAIEEAHAAVEFATKVRLLHAKHSRRGAPQREADIENALKRLKRAMAPIRAARGRVPYDTAGEITDEQREQLRKASDAIQGQRRRLWKMRKRKKNG